MSCFGFEHVFQHNCEDGLPLIFTSDKGGSASGKADSGVCGTNGRAFVFVISLALVVAVVVARLVDCVCGGISLDFLQRDYCRARNISCAFSDAY
jgi:hypothetical protein